MNTVLVIAADLDPKDLGGAEVHLTQTVKILAKKYDFWVLVGKSTAIKKIWAKNVKVLPVNYWRIPGLYGLCFIISSVVVGFKLLWSSKVSLIWAKQEFPQAVAAILLGKMFGLPVYVTAQNPNAFIEEMVARGITQLLLRPAREVARILTAWALRNAAVVGAVSSYAVKLARLFGATRVELVPNGVDLGFFRSVKRRKLPNRRVTIATTSTLIPRNAVDITLRGLALLPLKIDWQFLIAGDGPEKRNLQLLITELGIKSQVKFLGTLDNNGVKKLLSSADIFVRVSRFEGFGVSFLEAMAMGVPVITTHSGGQKDFVVNRETGMVVPVNDPVALSTAIAQVVNSQKLKGQIRQRSLKMVQKNYSWVKIAQKIDGIFQKII